MFISSLNSSCKSFDCVPLGAGGRMPSLLSSKQEEARLPLQSLVLVDVVPLECLTSQEVVQFELLVADSPTQEEALSAITSGEGISCAAMLDKSQVSRVIAGLSHEPML